MHYHLEIIMPQVEDVHNVVEGILEPFSENKEDSANSFWDWWQLGGRYSGSKLEARVPKEQLDAFYAELNSRGVTVSGITCGKQELQPADQIPMVDQLWREMCPGAGEVCPLFKHSGESGANHDTCTVADIPDNLTAYALIVAGLDYTGLKMEAKHLIHKGMWNGVTWIDTTFDGNVKKELNRYIGSLSNRNPEWVAVNAPKPDWIVVTVDYHS